MTIGSIIIRNDPVNQPERFNLTLKPAGGRGRAEVRFSNYRPTHHAEGGPWSTSFRVQANEWVLKELFENGLNRLVEVWGMGLEPNFEGFIEEMSFVLPPDIQTKSLRNLANKALMRADTDDDEVAERSDAIQNLDSQGIFGIFDGVLSGGVLTGSAVADQAVQQFIDLRAFPMPEMEFGRGALAGGSREPYIDVFCRGYIATLERRIYNQTAETDSQSLSSEIQTILNAIGEYIASQERDANTTAVYKEHDIDRNAGDVVMSLPRLGDSGNNRWLLYMEGRDCTGVIGRKANLKQAAPVKAPA